MTELLQGETLRERMRHRMPVPQRALLFAAQIARGLDAAHAHGIVHRSSGTLAWEGGATWR